MQVNPRTGLSETLHDFYNVPLVQQKNPNALKLNGQVTAVHTTPLPEGLSLDFYSKLGRSSELFITFMGANTKEKNFYPRFARVTSMKQKVPAFMAFADPSLLLDEERSMLLSWYLGGERIDPSFYMLKAIRRAQGKTGAKHIAFIGGSGGGFAALRMSSMIPGSLAFVQDSATNIASSWPNSVALYFRKAWPGWNQEKLIQAFPERFDMVRHYKNLLPDNFLYYVQNNRDELYRDKHYMPFKNAFGVTAESGRSKSGARSFCLYEGEYEGHGRITPSEFDRYFNDALEFWRKNRSEV